MKTKKFKIDLYDGHSWKYKVYCKKWLSWVSIYCTDSYQEAVEYIKRASELPEYYDSKGEKL